MFLGMPQEFHDLDRAPRQPIKVVQDDALDLLAGDQAIKLGEDGLVEIQAGSDCAEPVILGYDVAQCLGSSNTGSLLRVKACDRRNVGSSVASGNPRAFVNGQSFDLAFRQISSKGDG